MNSYEKLAKIAVHKSLLKEYSNSSNDRIVYMNDGTEFQIQIFNPYNYTIGVSFSFNNNYQGTSNLLVLRPGERVWLDRYLNNESRLLFSTYEVDNSKEVKEAIKDNGNLCIKFYKEKTYNNYWINNTYGCFYDNSITSLKPSSTAALFSVNAVNTALNSYSSAASTASTASTYNINNELTSTYKYNIDSSIETGRIEEGSHSNQKFSNVYKDFESCAFKSEYIKILPTSQKQYNSNDLKKRYCHECGRKLNQKFKFCPYCGAQL